MNKINETTLKQLRQHYKREMKKAKNNQHRLNALSTEISAYEFCHGVKVYELDD